MKVLHLLTSGHTGGIESLCRDIGQYGKMTHVFCFLTAGGVVCEDMQNKGMNVVNLEKNGGKFSIKKIYKLRKIALECDAVVVHHEDPFLRLDYIIIKGLTHKYAVSMVHSCYSDESSLQYNKLKRFIYRRIIQRSLDVSDAVWFVSHAGKISCDKLYKVDDSKSKVIYNGISPEFFRKASERVSERASEHSLKYGKPYNITYIGRLEHIKGVNLLIGAFAAVCLEYDVRLSIVGDGTERDKLEALVRNLNIEDKVTFYGQQVDIHPYLSDSSIFVYPSTWEEVFGISIIEAMAYGLPCIANNVGGIPEIIKDGENGFLTKEPTEEQIAFLIKKVIGMYERGEIESLSRNARDTAQRFSVVNTCRSIEGELDNTKCGEAL